MGEALRALRERRQLTLRSLAEQTGFSASFLSQVETGQASPSISSLEKIATALGVSLWQFFQAAEGGNSGHPVVRAGERAGLSSEWSKASVELLASRESGAELEPMLVTLEPEGASGRDAHPATHAEFAFVLQGRVELTLGDAAQTLATGDAVTIRAGLPRRWRNEHTTEPAKILIVALRPRR